MCGTIAVNRPFALTDERFSGSQTELIARLDRKPRAARILAEMGPSSPFVVNHVGRTPTEGQVSLFFLSFFFSDLSLLSLLSDFFSAFGASSPSRFFSLSFLVS